MPVKSILLIVLVNCLTHGFAKCLVGVSHNIYCINYLFEAELRRLLDHFGHPRVMESLLSPFVATSARGGRVHDQSHAAVPAPNQEGPGLDLENAAHACSK